MPREPEEYEQAWAQIVADLTTDDPGLVERVQVPDPTDLDMPAPLGDAEIEAGPSAGSEDGEGHGANGPSSPAGVAGGTADYHPSDWEDEGHFTPPHPPELPAGTPATRLGWAGVIGGPAVMAISALTGWAPPPVVLWGAGAATVAGFITLVWQLPDSRDDGWDEGARL